MKIILTRHGETVENKAGITQGHLPGTLSEDGIKQSKKLALRLKDEKINVIYSSDLARSVDTAKEIAKFHPNMPVHLIKELRERDMGEFQGTKKNDFEKAKKDGKPLPSPKEGESREELCARGKKLIDDIYEKHKDKTVLLVGHGGINLALVSAIICKPFMDVVRMGDVGNASVSIFEIDEEKNHKIRCLNCTEHLAEQKD